MNIKTLKLDAAWKKAALLLVFLGLAASANFVVRWSMAGSAVQRVSDADLALYLTQLAPDDPQTHFVAADYLEKRFDPDDMLKAIRELEIATALTPGNYVFWLELGRARERVGDPAGAEAALRRALQLAPNYSRVQWALGNLLLRQDRIEEAFVEIRKAVTGDPAYAGPAAAAAWQFFDGDVARIKAAAGESVLFNGALATALARESRFDEAMAVWTSVHIESRRTSLKDAGTALLNRLIEAKRYRHALQVFNDVEAGAATVATISNGGFELPVKPEGAGVFEWQIAAGLQPQIVLSAGQKHGGNNSLLLVFNSGDAKDFRPISQAVAIEPGKEYELELFYRSDLKTAASFRWEMIDLASDKPLAATDATLAQADWTRLAVKFQSGAGSDGVLIRLRREGCGAVCAVAGNLWFDDFKLSEIR